MHKPSTAFLEVKIGTIPPAPSIRKRPAAISQPDPREEEADRIR
jgi:hypothetical protein